MRQFFLATLRDRERSVLPLSRRKCTGTDVDVSLDAAECAHAAECVRGLPAVFDTRRKPWISPDGAGAADVVAVVGRCPSGALRIEREPAA